MMCMSVSLSAYVLVRVLGFLCLVGCVILRQLPVKMFHLLSGDLCTRFVKSRLSLCDVYFSESICVPYVLVRVLGSLCLVGCVIFRQLPVKMFHIRWPVYTLEL